MAGNPKRHHFVPQMLLEGFVDIDGWIYISRKKEPTVRRSRLDQVFLESHLYSIVDKFETKDTTLETKFSRMESLAAPILAAVRSQIRQKIVPKLSNTDSETLKSFFLLQATRTPGFLAGLAVMQDMDSRIASAIAQIQRSLGRPISDEDRAEVDDPDERKRIYKNAPIMMLREFIELSGRNETEFARILSKMDIQFGIASDSDFFIVGSQPVARVSRTASTNFTNPAVEMWLPISDSVAIRPKHRTNSECSVDLSKGKVDQINEAVFQQSDAVAAASSEQLKHFVQRIGSP